MKKMLALIAAAVAVPAFAGVTATWTGAVDNRWDNPGNWLVGGNVPVNPPGVIWDGVTGSPATPSGDTAVFGASSRTTIDLTNLYSIGEVQVTGSGAPYYTFGANASQILPLEPGKTLYVESSVPQAPRVRKLSISANLAAASGVGNPSLFNDSPSELVIESFGNIVWRPGVTPAWALSTVYLRGQGTITFAGPVENMNSISFCFGSNGFTGQLNIDENVEWFSKLVANSSKYTVNIAEGRHFWMHSDYNGATIGVYANSALTINGPGTFRIYDKYNANSLSNRGVSDVLANANLTFNCPVEVYPSRDNWEAWPNPQWILSSSTGNVILGANGSLSVPGGVVFGTGWYGEFRFPSAASVSGIGSFVFGANKSGGGTSKLVYTGSDDLTFTKTLTVTNGADFSVRNDGSGRLSLAGVLRSELGGAAADFTINAANGPIDYGCTLGGTTGPNLVLTGTQPIVFTASSEIPDKQILLWGNVDLRIEGGPRTLPSFKNLNNNNKISFTSPVTNVLAGIERAAGNLAITTVAGGAVRVAGATAKTAVPAGVKLNGQTPRFNAQGFLTLENVTATDVEIGAKGALIVEDGEKTVGITTEGTTGNDTIDGSFVLLKGLVQQSDYASTIALGSGDGINSGFIGIDAGGRALTIGDTAGNGLVETESIFNEGAEPLTVNAALSSSKFTVSGSGEVVFNGGTGSGYSIAAVTNKAGTVRLAAGEYVTANDSAFIAMNGGRTIVGDGTVIRRADDAAVTGRNARDATIQVGYGGKAVLEIESGAVISNQIITSRSQSVGNGTGAAGAVYQHGGTVYNTPGASNELRMLGGIGYSYGFWGLDAGSLELAKEVSFGYNRGIAIFQQTGGALKHTSNNIRMGWNGQAYTDWYQCGGTAQVAGTQIPHSVTTGDMLTSFTLTGAGTEMIVGGGSAALNVGCHNTPSAAQTNAYCWVNISDGARLVASSVTRSGVHRNEFVPQELYETNETYLNVDGGTIQLSGTWGGTAFGSFAGVNTTGVDRVTIYKGGMTLDRTIHGGSGNYQTTIEVPIRGATGKGVKSVEWTDRPELGMIGSPYVWIIGDGKGASAHAYFDTNLRKVTEVRVTSPGCDYTWAKAVFQYESNYSGSKKVWTNDVVLADNEIDGGLKVTGDGTIIFSSSQFPAQYRGPTEIAGNATLKFNFASAINPESKLILNGGTLNLGGYYQAFSDIETKAKTTLSNGKPVITGLTADLAAAVAGTPKNLDLSQFSFATGAKLTLVNTAVSPDPAHGYDVIVFSAYPTALDMSEALAQAPSGWRLRMAGNTLRLTAPKPTILLIR